MAAFLPNFSFSMDETIVVSLTDRFWRGDPALVFNLLVHELFHHGFVHHQRGQSPSEAADGDSLLSALLWQTQNEGMATYVAYRARPARLVFRDYELMQRPEEVAKRFAQFRELSAVIRSANRQDLRALTDRLWRECNEDRISYVAGAIMAQRIEQHKGVSALVGTVTRGPRAFLTAYRRTSPERVLAL